MCDRYYIKRETQEIARQMRAKILFPEFFAPNFNVTHNTFQPIVRQERDSEEYGIVLARWGLVPAFAKSPADFKSLSVFTARSEGFTKSAAWRGPLKSRRCLVPADGFYEWKTLNPATAELAEEESLPGPTLRARMTPRVKRVGAPKKQPYAITLTNGEPLAFAGLWDAWKEPKHKGESVHTPDRWLQSFSIITTEANEIMASIHTRMPVILLQRNWAEWLDRDTEKPPPIHLLRPYDSEGMRTDPCNPAVGSVKNNGPEMLVCSAPDTLPLNSA